MKKENYQETNIIVFKAVEHSDFSVDSLTGGQILKDVRHFLQRHSLAGPRVGH